MIIHHLSIPAKETRHVADVLAELFDGVVTGFGPYPNSWIAWAGDEAGTAIEVYPVGTEIYPPNGHAQALFRHNPTATRFTATHVTVSLDRSEAEILAAAKREGWRALRLPRGPFDVIEFWIENSVMLELMTPEMAAGYCACTPRKRRCVCRARPAPSCPSWRTMGGPLQNSIAAPTRPLGSRSSR